MNRDPVDVIQPRRPAVPGADRALPYAGARQQVDLTVHASRPCGRARCSVAPADRSPREVC